MFEKLFSRKSVAVQRSVGSDPPISLPPDVRELQSRCDELNSSEQQIHINTAAECISYTEALRSIGVGRRLGLIALDNANDSNPYCLITLGVAAGMVVHFFHDDEPMVEFDGLPAFERFLLDLRAGAAKRWWETERDVPVHPRQAELAAAIEDVHSSEDEDIERCTVMYMAMLGGEHRRLLQALSIHSSMYVREAVAETIARGRVTGVADLLPTLAQDSKFQVRAAARRALGLPREAHERRPA